MRILAIGAHPDDLEIFAYGTLAAWAEMGAELALVVATDGAAGGKRAPSELRVLRAEESRRALAPIGRPELLGFPDGALMHDRELEQDLRDLIDRVAPDLLLTHAPNDYHSDHRALSAAAAQAANFSVPVLYMDTMNGTGFQPTHWVDVTRHWPAKEAAIRAHQTQDPERFVASASRQAAFRSGEANAPPDARAEAFRFEPRFPFADIRALLPPPPPLRPVGLRRPKPR